MSTLRKIGKGMMYLLGTIIPNITFTIIFLTFMLTIISRYVFKSPIPWSYEVSILAYMWTMFFGVGKAMQNREHVVFSLVYDHVGPKVKIAFDVLTNVVLILLIMIAFIPSIDSLLSKKMVTGVLKMPYTVVFAPLIYMFGEIIIRCIIDLYDQVKIIMGMARGQK